MSALPVRQIIGVHSVVDVQDVTNNATLAFENFAVTYGIFLLLFLFTLACRSYVPAVC